ncbi:hypothetical protein [Flavobacterium aurantiibacter]|uniref:Potassium transporter KefB n=1 Tax=Flavobacterium aurantiibacter TaxID=2023067 RepID=A0A255ZQ55_9FLAO|nr:hypothetical protein [Flavobacterium aurantiibacter]OYQ43707.1 hypothetical protein CHX27_09000 [Flavobacterium aurantiibacter]
METENKLRGTAVCTFGVIGAAIGLSIIAAFLYTVRQPNPHWGSYWALKPVITCGTSGFVAGAILYILLAYPYKTLAWSIVGKLAGLVTFFSLLWVGMVAGLAGTFWN